MVTWSFVVNQLHRLAELDRRLPRSTANAFAANSGRGLRTHINKYVQFCKQYGLYLFNNQVLQFRRYLEHLRLTHKSVDSMKNYVGGARTLFEIMGFKPPSWADHLYKLTARGITRELGHVVKRAQPVTPRLLIDVSKHVDLRHQIQLVAWNATLLGFYTFLRKMNTLPVTLNGFDARTQVARQNLYKMGKRCYIIRVYYTKTIQNMERTLDILVLPNPETRICPIFWLEKMLRQVQAKPTESLFSVLGENGNTPLMYNQWTQIFQDWLEKAGYDPSLYSSYSMCRGGASWAAACKLPSYAIRLLGDWRSNCFYKYIEMLLETKYDAMCVFNMCM